MKALLLFRDDGLSAYVWLEMAKQHLAAGRPVLAITDDKNAYGVIGTGDGLPGYDCGLSGQPGFSTIQVSPQAAGQLMGVLSLLPPETVVMFNKDMFKWAARNPQWLDVIDHCAGSANDVVFTHCPPYDSWANGLAHRKGYPAADLLARVPWDYVAGLWVVTPNNLAVLPEVLPSLDGAISTPVVNGPLKAGGHRHCGAGLWAWQVLNHAGTFELRLPMTQLDTKMDAYPCLWDWHYPFPLKTRGPMAWLIGKGIRLRTCWRACTRTM